LTSASHAVSLGCVDTLVEHPVSMTHHIVEHEQQHAGGITSALVRISVGLEDEQDLWQDLAQALDD
jgi:methionine-gamma-lyase